MTKTTEATRISRCGASAMSSQCVQSHLPDRRAPARLIPLTLPMPPLLHSHPAPSIVPLIHVLHTHAISFSMRMILDPSVQMHPSTLCPYAQEEPTTLSRKRRASTGTPAEADSAPRGRPRLRVPETHGLAVTLQRRHAEDAACAMGPWRHCWDKWGRKCWSKNILDCPPMSCMLMFRHRRDCYRATLPPRPCHVHGGPRAQLRPRPSR